MAGKKEKKTGKVNMRMKWRMVTILGVFVVLLSLLIIRTGYIQIVTGDKLQKEAVEQQTRDRVVNSKRGSILDRNGKVLAVSASVETVSISPVEIKANAKKVPVESVAQGLAKVLDLEYEDVYAKITKNSPYEILKRKIEKDEADSLREYINKNKIVGVRLDADTKRFYPYGNFASHVIGFTGTDNQGLDGIEMMYDKYLKGSPGRIVSAKNAAGVDMPFKYEKMVDAQDGLNVVLTIDESIQRIVEKHLETAVVDNSLQNGSACIVMDVKSGEILAMATKPDFDLNSPFTIQDEETQKVIDAAEGDEKKKLQKEALDKMWRNKAVVDTYEPGSTFKMFTSCMALEEDVVKLDDTFTCTGSKKVATHNISCAKTTGHGTQTFVQAVQNSCNPAFIEIGQRIGRDKFNEYFTGFGFREKTGIILPGEAIGSFHQFANFNEVELATCAFGQSFTVTPLQMISGACAIANDGKLMKPKLVKQLTDKNNSVVEEFPDEFRRQIISTETSKTMRSILESVVSEGGGSGAYIKGYRVAGKTGTSEKLPRGNGKYVASFLSFAPADDPKIACLVMLDEPTGGAYYGGVIAAPVVRNILEEALPYLGVEPAYTAEELATLETTVPDVKGMAVDGAVDTITNSNLKYSVQGTGATVISQIPKAGVKVNQQSTIMLYTEEVNQDTTTTVPNVLNTSVEAASAAIAAANLNIKIVGAGSSGSTGAVAASSQDPPAGTTVQLGTTVTVEFKRLESGD